MHNNIFENRISRLRTLFDDGSKAALITNETNIGYFCGFFHSEGYLLVSPDKVILFVDFRYFEAAQKNAVCCEVKCFSKLFSDICAELKMLGTKNIYLETSDLRLDKFYQFSKSFKSISVESITDGMLDKKISEIRIVKDKTEVDKIQKAQKITEKAYLEVLNYLKPGVTERRIALELERLIKLYGGERVSFDLITISGKKTSLPHGVPSDEKVCEGDFFTFDIGAVFDGYHSDTTRTVAVKYADEEKRRIYEIVLKAQLAALDAVKPGVKCCEIDKAARDIINNAGYGKYFGHATGHGVGLDIHESPVVSPKSNTVLCKGMIITDEPGIYLPDKFGVRIEDMLCVTDDGYKNFVSLPKELIIV